MKIITLAENTCKTEQFEAEHGLSLYIEACGKRILFDMGQTDMFSRNAEKLGVKLSDVDIAVLSHGHYDHGGGLEKFLEINKKALVYINENAFFKYYNGTEKYIGLKTHLKDNERIVLVKDEHKICDFLTLYSCNDRQRKFEWGSFGLNEKKGIEFEPDKFLHEQYLLIEENGKKVLISGCSHKGILNIADWFSPDVLVGGFHFSSLALDYNLKKYAEILNGHKTAFYTCHCTGREQFLFMKEFMDKLYYISSGDVVEI